MSKILNISQLSKQTLNFIFLIILSHLAISDSHANSSLYLGDGLLGFSFLGNSHLDGSTSVSEELGVDTLE